MFGHVQNHYHDTGFNSVSGVKLVEPLKLAKAHRTDRQTDMRIKVWRTCRQTHKTFGKGRRERGKNKLWPTPPPGKSKLVSCICSSRNNSRFWASLFIAFLFFLGDWSSFQQARCIVWGFFERKNRLKKLLWHLFIYFFRKDRVSVNYRWTLF